MVLFELLDVADFDSFIGQVISGQIFLKVRHEVLQAYFSILAFTSSDERSWLFLPFEADCS